MRLALVSTSLGARPTWIFRRLKNPPGSLMNIALPFDRFRVQLLPGLAQAAQSCGTGIEQAAQPKGQQ
jgi:hypothetical protein